MLLPVPMLEELPTGSLGIVVRMSGPEGTDIALPLPPPNCDGDNGDGKVVESGLARARGGVKEDV